MAKDVDVSGPWFDARAGRAIREYTDYAEKHVAHKAAEKVKQNLHGVIKNPTGYYESQITERPDGEGWSAGDGGVVYGPWLEGTGSRNAPKTRFRGYSTFRKTGQEVDAEAASWVDPIPAHYMLELNL